MGGVNGSGVTSTRTRGSSSPGRSDIFAGQEMRETNDSTTREQELKKAAEDKGSPERWTSDGQA